MTILEAVDDPQLFGLGVRTPVPTWRA